MLHPSPVPLLCRQSHKVALYWGSWSETGGSWKLFWVSNLNNVTHLPHPLQFL